MVNKQKPMLFNFMGVYQRLDYLLEESNRTRKEVARLVSEYDE